MDRGRTLRLEGGKKEHEKETKTPRKLPLLSRNRRSATGGGDGQGPERPKKSRRRHIWGLHNAKIEVGRESKDTFGGGGKYGLTKANGLAR